MQCNLITRDSHDPAIETGYEYPELPFDDSGFSPEFKASVEHIGGRIWLNEVWLPNAMPKPPQLTGFVAPVAPTFDPASIQPQVGRVSKAWYAYKPLDRWCVDYEQLAST